MILASLAAFALALPAKETELTFKTSEGLELRGTFVEPERPTGKKLPALLLLPGSGPTDRNGNQPPGVMTDLLKQIAEALAKEGIATFRFDKRAAHVNYAIWPKGFEKADEFFAFEKFVDDARLAFDLLKAQPAVDAKRVGILGHSEGGLITLAVADLLKAAKVPSIALIGTAGRPLDVVLTDQIAAALQVQTQDEAVRKQYMDALARGIEIVKRTGKSPTDMPPGLQPLFGPGTGKILQAYFTIDPAVLAARYTGHVLLLQGEMDAQISKDRDFPALERAMSARNSGSLTKSLIPNASHNLKRVEKPSDAGFTGDAQPEALRQIVAWAKAKL